MVRESTSTAYSEANQAQKKLVARQKIRRNLSALSNLVSDSDDIF